MTYMRRVLAVTAAAAIVAGACGGSSPHAQRSAGTTNASDTTTSAAPSAASEATTTTLATTTPQRGAPTTTAVTTAKRSTATTAKRSAIAPAPKAPTGAPAAGIGNVTSETPAPDQGAQPGGSATVLKAAESPGFDPVQMGNSQGTDGWPGQAVFDYLVYTEQGTVKGQTAETVTSTDGLTWALKLRPNIRFTDGTPYDAAAVRFNIQRLQDPSNAAIHAPEANAIASMDATDNVTLRLTLKTKNAVFPQLLALMPFVGSPKAIQEKGTGFSANPVGAGPFMLKSWVRDNQMTLVRNPGYWNAPQPYLDQLVFKVILDETQRSNTFCSGQANMMYTSAVDTTQQVDSQKCGVLNANGLNGGRMLFMNMTKAPFNDPRVRQAVELAVDRSDYAKVVDNGVIPAADSPFVPTSPFFDSANLEPPYDPTKAQQLFDQVAADTGGPVTFTIRTYTLAAYVKGVTYLQSVLSKYRNVKVSVEPLSTTVQVTNISQGNFQAALYGQGFEDPDPIWLTRFTCDQKTTGFCDQKWDQAVADSRSTLDPNQRIALIKDAEKLLLRDVPVVMYDNLYTWSFTTPNVQGLTFVTAGCVLWNRMWLKSR